MSTDDTNTSSPSKNRNHTILNFGTPRHDHYMSSINNVISQSSSNVISQTSSKNNQINNDSIIKTTRRKRTNSLNTESYKDKKQKKDIYIDNFIETSRFINNIMERLDMLEDECNRLDSNNVALKDEYKLLKRYLYISNK